MPKQLTFFIILIFLLLTLFAQSKTQEAYIIYNGGKIDENDIIKQGAIPLYEFSLREAELKRQIMLEILKERLKEAEEKSSKKTWNQLIVNFIEETYDKELAEKTKTYFQDNGNKQLPVETEAGESNTPDGDENQESSLKMNAENKFMISLLKKYNVQFNLTQPRPPTLDINIKNQPYWGKSDAKITIVEFSDIECPYCKRMQPDIQKIKSKYSDKIKWVFIDFPLHFHQQAYLAHKAAYCAQDQAIHQKNLFFDMQLLLFQSSPSLDKSSILKLAHSLNLDQKKFEFCLNDQNGKKKLIIDRNVEYGQKLGISGTPTIFINGVYHPGLLNYNELQEIIDREL